MDRLKFIYKYPILKFGILFKQKKHLKYTSSLIGNRFNQINNLNVINIKNAEKTITNNQEYYII